MTIQVSGTPSPQPQNNPQGLNPQQQQLVDLGIPKEVVLQGDEAIQKYAATNGIQLPAKEQPAPTATVQAGQQLSGQPDATTFTSTGAQTDPTVAAARSQAHQDQVDDVSELRRQNEVYRVQTDPAKVALADALDAAQKARDEAKAAFDEANAAHNSAHKKTMKSTVTVDGQKVDKQEARAAADQRLADADAKLQEAERKLNEARTACGSDLDAIRRFNRERATAADDAAGLKNRDRVASQRAARAEVEDRVHSKEGREAIEAEYRRFARGSADGAERLKRGSKERSEVLDQIQDEFRSEDGSTISRRYARRMVRRAEKNLAQMEKEDALQRIIIGDKDKYKAERKDDEHGNPTVTYMSKETYEAARRYAASKGVDLPADATELSGDQMRAFQQVMIDAAGDFGSRGDLNERKGIADAFEGISKNDVKRMFRAANVDYQKDYTGAAIAAGAAAAAGTAFATGGLVDASTTFVAAGIGAATGSVGGIGLGNLGSGSGIEGALGQDVTTHSFNWGNAGISLAVGLATEELVRRIANNDPNLLKKGKTLEDAVYQELSGMDAFKKYAPNARKVLAKVLADTKLTPEQKLAYMQEAMGNGGPKLNGRELTALYVATRAHQNGGEMGTVEDKPELAQATVWDVNAGGFVDEHGQAVDIGNATLVDGNQVTENEVTQNQADGLAYDQRVVGRDKRNAGNAGSFDQVRDRSNIDAEGTGRLTNRNVNTHRSQYVISDEKGETQVNVGSGTVQAPDELTFKDNTNGVTNEYKYKKLSDAEAKAKGLNPEDGPFYELQSATGQGGKDITKTRGKVFKLHFSTTSRQAYGTTEEKEGDTTYTTGRTQYNVLTPHYDLEAADHLGQSSPHYGQTGARPDNK